MPPLMADERALAAIHRIEQALARIDTAASSRQDGGELAGLRQTHDALRGQVEGAIGRIDQLLASGTRG